MESGARRSEAAGLIALPIADIVAVSGAELEMPRGLSDIYGVVVTAAVGKTSSRWRSELILVAPRTLVLGPRRTSRAWRIDQPTGTIAAIQSCDPITRERWPFPDVSSIKTASPGPKLRFSPSLALISRRPCKQNRN